MFFLTKKTQSKKTFFCISSQYSKIALEQNVSKFCLYSLIHIVRAVGHVTDALHKQCYKLLMFTIIFAFTLTYWQCVAICVVTRQDQERQILKTENRVMIVSLQ